MKTPTTEGLAVALEDLGESLRSVCRELASSLQQPGPGESLSPGQIRPSETPRFVEDDASRRQLVTVKQFAATHAAFTEPSIRWLIYNGEWNRFDEVVVRVGRRVLIDTEKFGEWLELPPEEREAKPRP